MQGERIGTIDRRLSGIDGAKDGVVKSPPQVMLRDGATKAAYSLGERIEKFDVKICDLRLTR